MAMIVGGVETRVNAETSDYPANSQIVRLSGGGWVVTWETANQASGYRDVHQQLYGAGGQAIGAERRVNTQAFFDQDTPRVAALADGGWVVTWLSLSQDSAGNYGVFQQVYDAGGQPRGAERQVNTYVLNDQIDQSVTARPDGGWIVAWRSYFQDSETWGVYQQAFSADGQPLGSETRVNAPLNSIGGGPEVAPLVTVLSDGGWVVTWSGLESGSSGSNIYQQQYSSSGQSIGGQTLVNTYTLYDQADHHTTALDGGGWVVIWASSGQSSAGDAVCFQMYGANGQPLGAETLVNTQTRYQKAHTEITALDGGGWVITWTSFSQDGEGAGIYQRAYGANGQPLAGESRVNTYWEGDQRDARVVALSDGGWVVVWVSAGQNGGSSGVYQQVYNALGQAVGNELKVDSSTSSAQQLPELTALADGGWVVTWTARHGSDQNVYQKTFHINNDPIRVTDIALANGTENVAYSITSAQLLAGHADIDGDSLAVVNLVASDGVVVEAIAGGSFRLVPPADFNGVVTLSFTVVDGMGGSVGAIETIIFTAVNSAPVAHLALSSQLAISGSAFSFQFSEEAFIDADGDELSYAATLEDGSAIPEWLIFDAETRTFSGTPAAGDAGMLTISVMATDGSLTAVSEFDLTVADSGNPVEFTGTRGDDRLIGNTFDNVLDGKRGNDRLTGDDGADTFVFGRKYGRDVITDFDPAEGDMIDLSDAVGIRNFKDLIKNHLRETGDNVTIRADDGSVLVIRNIDADDLGSDMFIF